MHEQYGYKEKVNRITIGCLNEKMIRSLMRSLNTYQVKRTFNIVNIIKEVILFWL